MCAVRSRAYGPSGGNWFAKSTGLARKKEPISSQKLTFLEANGANATAIPPQPFIVRANR